MYFGHQERITQVHSNDPRNPVVTLTMTGEVRVAVLALPPMLSLGGVMQGEPMTQSIRLFPSAVPQVDVKSMEFNRGLFTMQNKEIEIRGKKGQEILVTLNSGLPPGEFKDELVIGVEGDLPPIRIPIWGAIVTQEQFAKLMKDLASEDSDVRSDAADALGEIHNALSTQPLIQVLLNDKSEEVRSSAADALGMKRATEALDALIKATSDSDVIVRDSAVEALDALGDARAEEALKRALTDEEEMVRDSAATALENMRRRTESR
jgi:hypothetical protein